MRRGGPRIKRHEGNYRKPLSPGLMIAITLRNLATCNTFDDTAFIFCVAPNTISLLVKEECEGIVAEYES